MKKLINLSIFFLLILSSCSTPTISGSSINSTSSILPSISDVSSTPSEKEYISTPYRNPLNFIKQNKEKYFVTCADPDIILGDDNYYYLYTTNTVVEKLNGTIEKDLGPIFKSKDLITWIYAGSVFDNYPGATEWGTYGAGVWAPNVIKVGDKWNYYYSLSTLGDANPGVGVAVGETPIGPWKHYGMVIDSNNTRVKNSIDPQAMYVDGDLYLIWGSFFGIASVLLSEDGIEPYFGHNELYKHVTYLIDNNNGDKMDLDKNYEGSFIIKKDNKYIYFGSQGTALNGPKAKYRVKTGMSDNFFGPYVNKDNKDLATYPYGDLVVGPNEHLAGTGHNTVVKDFAGDYWIFYHGFEKNGEFPNERVALIDKLHFSSDTGLPYVLNHEPSYQKLNIGPCTIK